MSNCNTRNCCFKGIDLVVKCYDPQPEFTDFTIPTWWFNVCTGKLYLLKGIDDDGKAIWIEITSGGAGGDGIQKILTQCGFVDADDSGQITHTGECGARVVAAECKDLCITVNTDWGLQGGKKVCAGESITLSIDKENTNLVTSSSNDVKDGDSIVYDGTNGKVIKKADQWRIGDTENSWTGKYNPDSKNFSIFQDNKSDSPILTMLPNGVTLMPWQPKVGAILGTTPYLGVANQDVAIGSTRAFDIKLDQDGYDLSAGTFFPGDGAGNGAYYTTKYNNSFYLVVYKFIIRKKTASTNVDLNIKIRYLDEYYPYRLTMPAGISSATVNDFVVIRAKAGERITWDIYATDGGIRIDNEQGIGAARNNYLGIYMLG